MSDSAMNSDAWAVSPGQYEADNPPRFGPAVARTSCYVTMRDGVDIAVDVGVGHGKATVWTCDLTHSYISINADYRS